MGLSLTFHRVGNFKYFYCALFSLLDKGTKSHTGMGMPAVFACGEGQFLSGITAIGKGTSVQLVIASPVTVIASDCFKV